MHNKNEIGYFLSGMNILVARIVKTRRDNDKVKVGGLFVCTSIWTIPLSPSAPFYSLARRWALVGL